MAEKLNCGGSWLCIETSSGAFLMDGQEVVSTKQRPVKLREAGGELPGSALDL